VRGATTKQGEKMRTKILVVGFAGLSLLAAAQSQSNEKKDAPKATTEAKSPRDLATGQASGRTNGTAQGAAVIHRDLATRDAATGQASGKTAQDDWHQQKAAPTGSSAGVNRVSAADVDGDGKADRVKGSYNVKSQSSARVAKGDVNGDGVNAAASSNSNGTKDAAAAGSSDVKSPRDSSTGMASGKRQHQPLGISKESAQQPNK
jgi:hypothetical protein